MVEITRDLVLVGTSWQVGKGLHFSVKESFLFYLFHVDGLARGSKRLCKKNNPLNCQSPKEKMPKVLKSFELRLCVCVCVCVGRMWSCVKRVENIDRCYGESRFAPDYFCPS